MRVGLAQLNTTVGDLDGNVERIVDAYDRAEAAGCDLAAFPELADHRLPARGPGAQARLRRRQPSRAGQGAPPAPAGARPSSASSTPSRDLSQRRRGVRQRRRCSACTASASCRTTPCSTSSATSRRATDRPAGAVRHRRRPGRRVHLRGRLEPQRPDRRAGRRRRRAGREHQRLAVLRRAAGRARADAGHPGRRRRRARSSTSTRSAGRTSWSSTAPRWCSTPTASCVARAPQFVEELLVVDLDVRAGLPQAPARPTGRAPPSRAARDRRHRAAAVAATTEPLGGVHARCSTRSPRSTRRSSSALRDYVTQERVHRRRASACRAASTRRSWPAIAADALGPEHVHGVSMPSRYSSDGSRPTPRRWPATSASTTAPSPSSPPSPRSSSCWRRRSTGREPDLTEENLQSRIRGMLLMALSNKFGWMVLTTGNKSEMAVGYSTLYGDTAGGFAVIKDVPKLLVYALCRLRQRPRPAARSSPRRCSPSRPRPSCAPTSATTRACRPTRCSTRSSRPTSRTTAPRPSWSADGFDEAVVRRIARLVDLAEYKRRQSPARRAGHARRRSARTAASRSPTATAADRPPFTHVQMSSVPGSLTHCVS